MLRGNSTCGGEESHRGNSFADWTKGTAPVVNIAEAKNATLAGRDRPAQRATIDDLCGPSGGGATNPDNIPLMVTNSLLGGSFGSRITSNIREQKGYTYSPSQPSFKEVPRRVLGGNCRRDDCGHRSFAERNFWRDRQVAEGSA